ncbi:hypothetical protein QBC41DRAFT_301707 [Cercophora samala]|uniref:Uncharacterized protein n=1 Tax=Cercophora samala TaxID=330535 RepID=A0AA40DBA9_9PEZI|nr:hypothetical protein QBC41DRAFT_301707 [Cercophora samala]
MPIFEARLLADANMARWWLIVAASAWFLYNKRRFLANMLFGEDWTGLEGMVPSDEHQDGPDIWTMLA